MTLVAPCGCVRSETVVGTCPQCLPQGAIEWLIEFGRQLDLFEDRGVEPVVRGDGSDGTDAVKPNKHRQSS